MQKQRSVEVVRCINEWANGGWDANEMTRKNPCTTAWINEPTNRWTNGPYSYESMKQGIDEGTKQWTNESRNRSVNQSIGQSVINEATKHKSGINASVNQWNPWINEPMIARNNESMNRWSIKMIQWHINESTGQEANKSINHWTNESMNQWANKATNQWVNESMSRWISKWKWTMAKRTDESMNQRSNESSNQ